MPQVSVIIPLYNKGAYIKRTLDSVLAQSFQDFEVIIVDDGSTDNGVKIVEEFDDPRIRLVRQDNQGVSAARNRGVNEAITELITFLDADDEWTPIHLGTICTLREKFPEAGLYSTVLMMSMPDGKMKMNDYQRIPGPPWEGLIPNYFESSVYGATPISTSAVGVPKKIFFEAGGFPRGYSFGEDHDLWGKIALKYPVAFSWKVGAIYHRESTNRLCEMRPVIDREEPFVITARTALGSGSVSPEFAKHLSEYIFKKEILRATRNVQYGNGRDARIILKNCKTKTNLKLKIKWYLLSLLPYPMFCFIDEQKFNISTFSHRIIGN